MTTFLLLVSCGYITHVDQEGRLDGLWTDSGPGDFSEVDLDDEVPDQLGEWLTTSPRLPEATGPEIHWVVVPPGKFHMGSLLNEVGHEDTEDIHPVVLSAGFEIMDTELTIGQYAELMGTTPPELVDASESEPVRWVSWHMAAETANLLSARAQLPPCYGCETGEEGVECRELITPVICDGVRLPTEAEWEYAARAGSLEAFYNGENLSPYGTLTCEDPAVLDKGTPLAELAWYCSFDSEDPHEVAELAPNGWGLYDVAGNVAEWTHDWFSPYPEGVEVDPAGPPTGNARVFRGGAFHSSPAALRSAQRAALSPDIVSDDIGFRLVRTIRYETGAPGGDD